MYEVELKFPLTPPGPVLGLLEALGAVPGEPVSQRDAYYGHPVRDFKVTDEALRIRAVGVGGELTYKGPVIDSRTKTRREIEVPFHSPEEGARLAEILVLLGFRLVHEVRKLRRPLHLEYRGRTFEIAVDEVEGLGTYLELETLADEANRGLAVEALLQLASEFQLPPPERRSYLCLLLEKNGKNP